MKNHPKNAPVPGIERIVIRGWGARTVRLYRLRAAARVVGELPQATQPVLAAHAEAVAG